MLKQKPGEKKKEDSMKGFVDVTIGRRADERRWRVRHLPWPVDDAGCGLRSVSCISNSHLFSLIVCIKEILESRVVSRLWALRMLLQIGNLSWNLYVLIFLYHSRSLCSHKKAWLSFKEWLRKVTHNRHINRSTTIFDPNESLIIFSLR